MSRIAIHLLSVVALAMPSQPVFAAATETSAQTSDDANTRAHTLFRQAYAAYNAHNYEESRQLLLQAWTLRQTYDVASALAQSETKLKLYREAATHLQYCLDTVAPSTSQQTLEAIKQAQADVKSHVGTLHITTNRESVSVTVDGQPVGMSPLTTPVYVDPGQHEIEFKQGVDSANSSIDIESGADLNIDVPLEHVAPPPVPAPVAAPPTLTPSASKVDSARPSPSTPTIWKNRYTVPAIIDGAIFAIGVGMTIGFRLSANSNDNQAEALRNTISPNGCAPGSPANPNCASLLNAAERKDTDRNWSTAGMVVAGMALVAVPVYWYWPRPNSSSALRASNLRLNASLGSQYSGLGISSDF